jgi:small conductance mechanosensitive channel
MAHRATIPQPTPGTVHGIRPGLIVTIAALCFAVQFCAQPAPAQEAASGDAKTSAIAQPVSRADVDRLIRVLEDPQARAKLIEELRAPGADARPVDSIPTPPQVQDRPGTRFLVSVGEFVSAMGVALSDAASFIADLPRFFRWVGRRFADTENRARIAAGLGYLAAILGVAGSLHWGTAILRRRWRRRIEARESPGRWRCAGYAAAGALAGLAPPLAFWAGAMAMVAALRPDSVTTLIAVAAANAQALTGLILAAPRAVLAPATPGLRLAPVGDEMARRIYAWLRATMAIAVFGYFLAATSYAAGLPPWAYALFAKLTGVAITVLLALAVARGREEFGWAARRLPAVMGVAFHRRGGFWQAGLLFYLAVALIVWLAEGDDGIAFLARATASSLAVMALAIAATAATYRGAAMLAQRVGLLGETATGLGERLGTYLVALSRGAAVAVALAAILAVAAAWRIPVIDWLAQAGGAKLATNLVSLGLIAAVGIAIWEGLNLLTDSMARSDEGTIEGMRRAARRRTLLPLVRRASMAVLGTMLALMALSEVGINVAPLIAGAGVVGIAVGLGAQKIVRDLLGGMYVLAEDSIAVGDVVNVAGKGGVVEWMSLRSLRLRDFDGTVHTVPFGDITTVSNLTKNFAYAVFKVGVSYEADIDRVHDAVRDVAARMRQDMRFARMILDDVELHGIDSFTESTVVVLARLKVAPARQWDVTRQFQMLLKRELERRGISQRPLPLVAVPWQPRRADETAPPEPPEQARARA